MSTLSKDSSFRVQDILVPGLVAATLLIALVTLPSSVMDLLLSISIALSVIILLTAFFVRRPLEFSIFPTILLISTLFRLVLNIATTRLILTRANDYGELAAGQVIKSFSSFVTGESLVVGLVIFSLFIVIQFVVITKGATRISEVAARFTLDAMPGRQMAIDADLHAGAITEAQARAQRQELTEQADFFGAMDGASKFVRGDAIASLIIVLINILGGLFIGIVQHKMSALDALSLYTTLTIGDGLVSQIPALLISLATGILISRSRESKNLSQLLLRQLLLRPEALLITGIFLCVLACTGLPPIPMLSIGLCCFVFAFVLYRKNQRELNAVTESHTPSVPAEQERIESYLTVDPLELEIGVGLLPLADPNLDGDILARIRELRQETAVELGIILPKVRIRDNLRLDDNQYRIKLNEEQVAFGMIYPSKLLARAPRSDLETLPGISTSHPIDGAEALWIEPSEKERALNAGYEIRTPVYVIISHLREAVRREAEHFLTRDAVKHLLQELHSIQPIVVDELIPDQMSLVQVQQILRLLLREQIPIRPLAAILETLGNTIGRTNNPYLLTEQVRIALARTICGRLRDEDQILHVLLCSPELEQQIRDGFSYNEYELECHLPPAFIQSFLQSLGRELSLMGRFGFSPVLLVSPMIRFAVRELTAKEYPELYVLSTKEISSDTRTVSEGTIDLRTNKES